MKKVLLGSSLLILAMALAAANSSATIVSTVGMTVIDPPPTSVVEGYLEGSLVIFEESAFTFNSFLFTDYPGTPLLPGTEVISYLIHADSEDESSTVYSGSVTFDKPILGLFLADDSLNDTDSAFGYSGTTYPNGVQDRGLEGGDSFAVSADGLTLTLEMAAGLDQVRVIIDPPSVEPVPEPGTLLLLGSGLIGLAGYGKFRVRRRKK